MAISGSGPGKEALLNHFAWRRALGLRTPFPAVLDGPQVGGGFLFLCKTGQEGLSLGAALGFPRSGPFPSAVCPVLARRSNNPFQVYVALSGLEPVIFQGSTTLHHMLSV